MRLQNRANKCASVVAFLELLDGACSHQTFVFSNYGKNAAMDANGGPTRGEFIMCSYRYTMEFSGLCLRANERPYVYNPRCFGR